MAMVDVDSSCQFSVDSQPKSIVLVLGLVATQRSVCIHQMNRVNSRSDFGLNSVVVVIILIIITSQMAELIKMPFEGAASCGLKEPRCPDHPQKGSVYRGFTWHHIWMSADVDAVTKVNDVAICQITLESCSHKIKYFGRRPKYQTKSLHLSLKQM